MSNTRLLSLDLLRTLACALVIANHISAEASCPEWLSTLKMGGWIGVDLFFVLSGFLVSGLLFREYQSTGDIRVRRFLARRGLKIYPAFYTFFFLCLIPGLLQGQFPTWKQFFGETLFLQNYLGRLWNHTWTLAVEEHFYLAISFLIAYLVQRHTPQPLRVLPSLLISLCVALPFFRVASFDGTWQSSALPSHLRADSLSLGVLLSYGWHFYPTQTKAFFTRYRWLVLSGSLCLFAPAFLWPKETTPWLVTWGLSGFAIASGGILMSLLITPLADRGVLKQLAYIGTFSYSIYLWHMPVIWWITPILMAMFGTTSAVAELAISLVISAFVGKLMAEMIEFPVLRLRNMVFPDSTASQVQTRQIPQVPLATRHA